MFTPMKSEANPAAASATRQRAKSVGELLKAWRCARRLSQLELALDVQVSQRHLSCVETGRSRPSPELIEQLAEALAVPLRERNVLFLAAGYAPRYRESRLESAELAKVRQAIDLILRHQEPYPAFVANRRWDEISVNDALPRLLGSILGRPPRHRNILHRIFDPDDVRPVIANWSELAGDLLRHLRRDAAELHLDDGLQALLNDLLAYPGVPDGWRTASTETQPPPMIETRFHSSTGELRFFSTLTTFAGAHDLTLDELHIECMFPADDFTARFCRELMTRSGR